jgi:hypothetical protein
MNLPDYFLADLPPEAALSPTMIAAACHTLKRNREKYLRPRPKDAIVKILCEVAAEWLQPGGNGVFKSHFGKGPGRFLPPVHAGEFSVIAGTGTG